MLGCCQNALQLKTLGRTWESGSGQSRRKTDRTAQAETFQAIAREWLAHRAKTTAAITQQKATWLLEQILSEIGSRPIRELTARAAYNRAQRLAESLIRDHCRRRDVHPVDVVLRAIFSDGRHSPSRQTRVTYLPVGNSYQPARLELADEAIKLLLEHLLPEKGVNGASQGLERSRLAGSRFQVADERIKPGVLRDDMEPGPRVIRGETTNVVRDVEIQRVPSVAIYLDVLNIRPEPLQGTCGLQWDITLVLAQEDLDLHWVAFQHVGADALNVLEIHQHEGRQDALREVVRERSAAATGSVFAEFTEGALDASISAP